MQYLFISLLNINYNKFISCFIIQNRQKGDTKRHISENSDFWFITKNDEYISNIKVRALYIACYHKLSLAFKTNINAFFLCHVYLVVTSKMFPLIMLL